MDIIFSSSPLMNLHVFYFGVKIFYTTYSNFVDPDPNGIRIQQFCGSVYGILIRIHTIKIGEKGFNAPAAAANCDVT